MNRRAQGPPGANEAGRLEAFFRDELRAAEAGAPSPEDLAGYVDGTLDADRREALSLALADDAVLQQELADLVEMRSALRSAAWRRKAIAFVSLAAAAGVALGVAALFEPRVSRVRDTASNAAPPATTADTMALLRLRDAGGVLALGADGTLGGAGLAGVPDDLRARVAAALRSGRPAVPDEVRDLGAPALTLMGGGDAGGGRFAVLAPLATVVRSDRPTFRWSAHAGARAYVVSVFDQDLNRRASSGETRGTLWECTLALERGRTYLWQVAALTSGGGRVVAPAPPQPEARFRVLASDAAAALRERLRASGGSHLVAGVLLAEAGVLDDAERELRQLVAANPGSPEAQRLLTALRRSRASAKQPPAP